MMPSTITRRMSGAPATRPRERILPARWVRWGMLAGVLWAAIAAAAPGARAQEPYTMAPEVETRWLSFENPTGAKGRGGTENQGAKGHAFDTIDPGETVDLADIAGSGVIHRLWVTVDKRSPFMLRSLRLRMTWDEGRAPAVDVPFGDFFGLGLGRLTAFENALFSTAEGRSFTSYVKMPFRQRAHVTITNESSTPVKVFYVLNYTLEAVGPEALYFHARWRRERPTQLGEAFEVLPRVEGRGRYLGASLGVVTGAAYGDLWWGEGEPKVYLDGDAGHPTLVGTGTEDYIGTGWGQGVFINRYQGCTIAKPEQRRWAFYRFHMPDPVYFHEDLRVTLQQMGGGPKAEVARLLREGAALEPVSIDPGPRDGFAKLLADETPAALGAPELPDGWTNFYREDDVASTVYFYLDRPASGLPALAPVGERTAGLNPPEAQAQP